MGCADIYLHDIDCQWIDITEVPIGNYTFKVPVVERGGLYKNGKYNNKNITGNNNNDIF